jgi:hypothetical protein
MPTEAVRVGEGVGAPVEGSPWALRIGYLGESEPVKLASEDFEEEWSPPEPLASEDFETAWE